MIDFTTANEKIIIYGAGVYARILFSYLQVKCPQTEVTSFVVANANNNPSNIDGVCVKTVDSISEKDKNYRWVLAVSSKNLEKVIENIGKIGIQNFSIIRKLDLERFVNEIMDQLNNKSIINNRILFNCHNGMGYFCNCKYLAQEYINQGDKDVYWVCNDIEDDSIPNAIKKIRNYSKEYFTVIATAQVCIFNSHMPMYYKKRENQIYVNTWHGTGPFKKVNLALCPNDLQKKKELEKLYKDTDLFISNSLDNTEMFRESFCYDGEIIECGSPRNDILFYPDDIKKKVYEYFEIDQDMAIVLYAPTYRDGINNSFAHYDIDMKSVLESLEKRFGGKYILMYKFHHMLVNHPFCINYYDDGINATSYLDTQELIAAADVLITDYSSIMWDFSLMKKPVFLYMNDENEYENEHGFYSSPKEWPYMKGHSSQELCDLIERYDEIEYKKKLERFFDKYKSYDAGDATEQTVERIYQLAKWT